MDKWMIMFACIGMFACVYYVLKFAIWAVEEINYFLHDYKM